MKISVVSPIYEAENIVDILCKRIIEEVDKITPEFEIILVEDGSQDQSWKAIVRNCKLDKRVKGIRLSRNFGQHYAVTAGVNKADGDFIVLMDCDLQDDPTNIVKLYLEFVNGNEIIFTNRIKRKHSILKTILSKFYNLIFNILSDRKYDVDAGSLIGFGKKAQQAFNNFPDRDRLYIQLLKWVGFQSITIPVTHHPRYEGKSTYKFYQSFILAVQGLTSHSTKMLKFNIWIGFFLALISFMMGIVVIYRYFVDNLALGSTSIIVAIFFSTGIILVSVGIVGLYVGKTLEQSKHRALYIIQEEIN